MTRAGNNSLSWSAVLSLIACGSILAPGMARAQERDNLDRNGDIRREDAPRTDVGSGQDAPSGDFDRNADPNGIQNADQGVVRLARFASVRGNVTWRADEGLEWSQATTNLPLRQGAQIWVTDGGRAEVQFDDGSLLRLGSGALVTLKTLYSDQDGEFTQITVTEGLATLRARHERGVYRMDTPLVSVTARGPARVRLGVSDGVEVAVREGQASIEGGLGKATMQNGDYLDLRDANTPYDARRVPGEDNWDRWNDERDAALDGAVSRPSHQYLPSNIAIVATDLDDNGTWRDDPEYGHVWCPRVESADWRPYYQGHWTWVNPFGWTWVSDESWGWAPYHYGTWVSRSYGWAWRPGPVNQYWSPAVVHFTEYGDRVAWCALAPSEVRYPSLLSVGFRSGNWNLFFSIGQAAVYYPSARNYCEARPFRTNYVNHVTYVNNVTNVYNNTTINRFNNNGYFAANHNQYVNNSGFVPYNARTAAGATYATKGNFGARTAYQTLPRSGGVTAFTEGRFVGAPPAGARPIAGPLAVQPTREALTPLHSFASNARPPAAQMNRAVYNAPLPANIGRRALPITPGGEAMSTRGGGAAGSSIGNPNRTYNPGGVPGRTQASGGSGSASTGGARTPGGYTPANGSVYTGRTSPGAAQGGGRVGSDPRAATGAVGTGSFGGRTSRPSTGGGTDAAQAAAQARASLGQSGSRAQAGSGTARTPGTTTGGGFSRPSGTAQSGSGTGSRAPYGGGNYGSSGSDTRTSRPGNGSPGTGNSDTYDRMRNNPSGGASRYPSDGNRSGYTPAPRPSGTGSGSGANGSGSGGSGYNRDSRNYDGRTSAPQRGSGDTPPRSYTPAPQRQYTPPPAQSAPQRQYTPAPAPQRQPSPAPAPRDRGSDSGTRNGRSGDSKDNKDGKGGKP